MLIRSFFLLFALSLSSPSFAAKPISLPMPLAEELQVEMVESQQEIAVVVPTTATDVGMQYGLIGLLIGSAIQNSQVKNAEEKIVPLRNLLLEYPFNQKMAAALRAKLAAEGISPSPVLTVMATPWEAHDAQQSATLPLQAMVLVPGYAMDNGFSQMTVSLRASVVDRAVRRDGKVKTAARFSRLYSFHYPLQGARSEDEVQDWIKFGTDGIAQLLDQGIDQVTDMLVQDFSAEGRATWNIKPRKQSAVVNGNVYAGMPVRQGDGWAWVRNGKGWMQSLQGFQPLTVGTLPVLPQSQITEGTIVPAARPVALPASGKPASVGGAAESPVSPAAAPAPDAEPAPAATISTGG